MVKKLPIIFRTATDTIVSIGLTDFATGKAITDLYAGMASGAISGGNNAFQGRLSQLPFYSDFIFIQPRTNNAIDKITFDLDFNLPQIIEGTSIVQVPLLGTGKTGSPRNVWAEVGWEKVTKAGAIIDIASGATRTLGPLDDGATSGATIAVALNIPNTKFIKGEKLRLKLFLRSVNAQPIIGMDPKSRTLPLLFKDGTTTIANSALIAQVPFKLNL